MRLVSLHLPTYPARGGILNPCASYRPGEALPPRSKVIFAAVCLSGRSQNNPPWKTNKNQAAQKPCPLGLWVRYLRGERKAEGNRAEAPGSLLQVTRMPDQAPSRLNQRFGETRARFRRGFGHVFLNQLTRSCFMSASISRYVPYTHGDSPPLISGTDCGLGGNAAPPACVLCKAWPAVLSCLGTQAALWPQAAGGPFKWQNRQQKAQKCEKRGNKETVKRTLVYSRSCKEKAEHRALFNLDG